MKKISENFLQAQCHTWLWNSYPELRYCCFHIANERKCSVKEGAILKAKGVVAGVPDYVVNINGKTYYFELKTEVGVLSDAQKKCHEQLKKQGFDVYIIRDIETFIKLIQTITKIK